MLRMILPKLGVLPIVLFAGMADLPAQTPDERYYPYEQEEEPWRPMIETDSSLFYRAAAAPADLYGETTRYGLAFAAADRRGTSYRKEEFLLGGVPVDRTRIAALERTGIEFFDRQASPFSDSDPASAAYRLSTRITDRNYRVGARFEMTRPLGRGWRTELSAEGRTGRDLHIEGVYTRSLQAVLRVEKHWGSDARFALLAAASPEERGLRSSSTEETYVLLNDNYYNPAWGFCDGKVRSSRVRREFVPLLAASAEVVLSPAATLRLTAGAEAGIRRQSSLAWFDARTPQPDNYRSLPSYFTDPALFEFVADKWRSGDSRYTQIDWDELIRENRMAGGAAVYAEQDRVERITDLKTALTVESRIGRGWTLHCGVDGRMRLLRRYKELRDLLGADYLIDRDYYLIDDDTWSNSLQNDLRHPDRHVGEGGHFGYDYAFEEFGAGIRMQAERYADRLTLRLGARIEERTVRRRGYYEKELFPAAGSCGRSRPLRFAPYDLHLEAGYAFSPRSYLALSLRTEGRAPETENLFLQPEYNNRPIDAPALERRHAAEITFRRRGVRLQTEITGFFDLRCDGTETDRYYDDLSALFCDRAVTGIATCCCGIEAAARLQLDRRWTLRGAVTVQRGRYVANPSVTLYADTDNRIVSFASESHMGGCRPGALPSCVALAGADYFGKGWGLHVETIWLGTRYAHPDFMRRTVRIAEQAADSAEAFRLFNSQERLAGIFRLDLSLWKSIRIGSTRLVLFLAAKNLTGDRSSVYDAYESPRLRRLTAGDALTFRPFDSRRTYAYPRSLYLSASVRF